MVTSELVFNTLRNSIITADLRDTEIHLLASLITIRDYMAGDIILRPNDEKIESSLLIIAHGEAEASIEIGNDKFPLSRLCQGDLAAVIGFLGGTSRQISATVIAKSNLKVLVLERSKLEQLLASNPVIIYYVMRGVVRSVHGIMHRMNSQSVELNETIHFQNYVY